MGLEGWLSGIRDDLRAKTYRPEPVRRAMVPKPGGGERPLGIPTIRDRVVQGAVKLVIETIFEAGSRSVRFKTAGSMGRLRSGGDQCRLQGCPQSSELQSAPNP